MIFTGGSTGKGFDGSGYTGQGTPSRFSSWLDRVGADIAGGPGTSGGSTLVSLMVGDEGAVPVNAVVYICISQMTPVRKATCLR